MRAIAITATDGPSAAALHELERPQPATGQVRIALAASSLNHADIWASHGQPRVERRLPFVLGVDGAGAIDAVGTGVDEGCIGSDVVVNPVLSCGRCEQCASGERMLCRDFRMIGEHVDGTHAEAICVPAICAVPRPAGLSAEEAAAGATVFATAYRLLYTRGRLRAGERVLIHGIGGGLATAALQLAKVAGAEVAVTSSDDAKLERARALGADHGVNYRSGDVVREVRAAIGAADVIVDSVGAAVWEASFRLLAPGGRLVNAGATGGDRGAVPIVHLFWRQLELIGTTMASDAEFRRALDLMVTSGQRAVVDRTVALEDVPDALLALERGEQFGKIVVSRSEA
jgi:NADPH:quinone reductase-like Zn-dependent oxidoreductase